MLVVLPLICFLVFLSFFWIKVRSWREAILYSAIVCGLIFSAGTEFLSALDMIKLDAVAGLWGMSCLVGIVVLGLILKDWKTLPWGMAEISYSELLLLVAVVGIVAIVGLIALVAPPTTWDSMTYHMSRVVHWIQDRNVAFYPTHIRRQLHLAPGAEFAVLHLQILGGGDQFANLPQWFTMIGCIIGVSLITKVFGAERQTQITAAVITATIPMGILQGSSNQTDYVASFWLVSSIYFILSFCAQPKWIYSLATASSLALAILTKATAYIYALPFLAWFVFSCLRSLRWKSWQHFLVVAVIALTINLGQYIRNFDLYGNPLGPSGEGSSSAFNYANDIFTLPSVASNSVRNLALHIGTPANRINERTERAIYSLHTILGIDVDDPRTTWGNAQFHVPTISTHEDVAGNPIHLALIFASLILYLAVPSGRKRGPGFFACALVVAFLLFSLYLKWQPWNSRLHLPLFVLWSPFIAWTLASVGGAKFAARIALLLVLASIPWLVSNQTRPVIGQSNVFAIDRIDQYFKGRSQLREPYVEVAGLIKSLGCPRIGLVLGGDDWEYPLWALIKHDTANSVRIENVGVDNVSAAKEELPYFSSFTPCAVIKVSQDPSTSFYIRHDQFTLKWSSGPVGLFVGKEGSSLVNSTD